MQLSSISLGIGALRGAGGPSVTANGLIGLYWANQVDTAKNAIPNAAAPLALSANILRAPRRCFANPEVWAATSATPTDNAAVDKNGHMEASVLEGVGNWYLQKIGGSVTYPAGTYTIAYDVKSNGAGKDTFAFTADNTATHSPVKTADGTWRPYSYPFTKVADWNLNGCFLCSADGATDASLQIDNARIYAGAVDINDVADDGNLYLGAVQGSASPVTSGGVIDMTGQGYGYIQLPAALTLTNATAMALVSKTADGSGYDAFLSKIQSYGQFSAFVGINNVPYGGLGTGTQLDDHAGLWNLKNQGFHVITLRFDGTNQSLWLDDLKLFEAPASVAPYSLRDLFVGIVNTATLYCGLKAHGIAFWSRDLTDLEVRTSGSAMRAHGAAAGLTMADARVYSAEGNSITVGAGVTGYPYVYGASASPAVLGNCFAVSGAVIGPADGSVANSLWGRAAQVNAVIPPFPGSRKFILSVLDAANDLPGYSSTNAWLAAYAAYLDHMRTAGWIVVIATITPATTANLNSRRAVANPEMLLWTTNGSIVPGKHADHVIDFGGSLVYGQDADASDAAKYPDGQHPSQTVEDEMAADEAVVVNAI